MKNVPIPLTLVLYITFPLSVLISCSLQKQISRSATKSILKDPSLTKAHLGISIFEPASTKFWYNYQGDHYFVPASNTKIPTCYAAMKYLGDSLAGILKLENDTAVFFIPTGDPTLLDPAFSNQPVIRYLQNTKKKVYATDSRWNEEALGSGWSWNDFNESYMAERSPMPVYDNLLKWVQEKPNADPAVIYSIPEVDWNVDFDTIPSNTFSVTRTLGANKYRITEGKEKFKETNVPFVTNGINTALELLSDTVNKIITLTSAKQAHEFLFNKSASLTPIHSQSTDSLLKPMMHRSDNFFAEQALLMVSNELLGVMNDEKIIDTLLKTDFRDLPQKPVWVDGSGLSRYNLFSPEDFVFLLDKMKNDFGLERIKTIFPTGNEGTLNNYYVSAKGQIFAKTGSLSGVVTISGFLYTKKNKLLIFSVLVNNHNASATAIRRVVEKFILGVRDRY
ncbi:MAG TPA: D-alanyl-D-alanine carboxypeptidase [Chitinophagaceae bacterium]|nr:D-alanyl-D-alanine carboxypeptidase [Chitinophagaceae bacterium]